MTRTKLQIMPMGSPAGLNHRAARKVVAAMSFSVLAFGIAQTATAQQAQTARPDPAARTFDIPAGPLGAALLRFGAQSGVQFNVDSALTEAKSTAGVQGVQAIPTALATLLDGSGLTFRFTGPQTVVIETAIDTGGARLMSTLRVEGAGSGAGLGGQVSGVNGSNDPTATEGSGSYTAEATSVASKVPQALKDTPQSVSVVTQQRLADQTINNMAQLIEQSPGLSTITGTNGPLNPEFYSRGLRVERIQIDGGAPISIANGDWGLNPQIDLAMYDHAEILRGADGLFNGYGNPGGVINLARKRPLDHFQLVTEGQFGSWNHVRGVVDVTGPLALDGHLRGRLVGVAEDQDFFYKLARSSKASVYGGLDYDLTPSTLLNAGFSRTRQHGIPFVSGLPRFLDGADLGLPRNTCLCAPWGRFSIDTTELFGRIEQNIGADWTIKAHVTRIEQDNRTRAASVSNGVNPVTLQGPEMLRAFGKSVSTQTAADATLTGSFRLLGHVQRLVIGANYANADGGGSVDYLAQGATNEITSVNVLAFDPHDPAYRLENTFNVAARYPTRLSRQVSGYATLQLTAWEPLHLSVGFHYTRLTRADRTDFFCANLEGCVDFDDRSIRYALGDTMFSTSARRHTSDFAWPPNMSAVLNVTRSLSVYASYADILQEQAESLDISNNTLPPIRGSNIESGIKWAAPGGRLNFSLSGYRIRQTNWAVYVGRPAGQVSIFGTTCCYSAKSDNTYKSDGIDFEVTGEVLPGWQLSTSYTWNRNKYAGVDNFMAGDPLQSRLPEHLLKLWTTYQFQGDGWRRRLSISGGINAQSKGFQSGRICPAFFPNDPVCPTRTQAFNFRQAPFAVVSTRLSYQLTPQWQLAANVNNLFDHKYYATVNTPANGNWYGEPRNVLFTVRSQF